MLEALGPAVALTNIDKHNLGEEQLELSSLKCAE